MFLKLRNNRGQQVVVSVLDRRKVVLTAGHCRRSCEKVKSNLMGISQSPRFPLILIRSPNHIGTRLILLTQPLLIHPTCPTSIPGDVHHLCHVFQWWWLTYSHDIIHDYSSPIHSFVISPLFSHDLFIVYICLHMCWLMPLSAPLFSLMFYT